MGLEEAREKATDARKVRRNGGDPIQAKREADAAARIEVAKAITFGEAAKRFIKANRAGWKNAKHADQWLMTLLGIDQTGKPTKNDYCKTIRDLPIGAIDTTLVLRIIEPIWASKTETATRIRSRIEQVIYGSPASMRAPRCPNACRMSSRVIGIRSASSRSAFASRMPTKPSAIRLSGSHLFAMVSIRARLSLLRDRAVSRYPRWILRTAVTIHRLSATMLRSRACSDRDTRYNVSLCRV